MKKIVTLATSKCGYCKMLKGYIDMTHTPSTKEYEYVVADIVKELSNDGVKTYKLMQTVKATGVPFTALFDGSVVLGIVRGYDRIGIDNLFEKLQMTEPSGVQLDLFEDNEEE